jgi:NADPH:quinone reductase-like Zn-dependent oxidoreductase
VKAFVIERYGPDTLRLAEMPKPQPRDTDVLVQIHAASVNPVDFKIRDGKLKPIIPYRLPIALGNDLSGVVVEVGAAVRGFKPGDEVYARADKDRIGSFAEFIAVQEAFVALKPASLSMQEAASIPLVALTALQAFERAGLKAGQKVLIHAGSGGVGTVAIQLAKHLGAFVATTSSSANIEWVKALGADVIIDYKTQDFATMLRDYDMVLDTLGEKVLAQSLQVLRRGGQIVSISGPPDPAFAREWQLGWVMEQVFRVISYKLRSRAKRRGVSYSFLFMKPSGEQLREIGALFDAGELRPVVDRVFPFAETVEALRYVERGHAKGKVVIDIRSPD